MERKEREERVRSTQHGAHTTACVCLYTHGYTIPIPSRHSAHAARTTRTENGIAEPSIGIATGHPRMCQRWAEKLGTRTGEARAHVSM